VKSRTGNRFSSTGFVKSSAGNHFSRIGFVNSSGDNRFSHTGKGKSVEGNRFSRDGFVRSCLLHYPNGFVQQVCKLFRAFHLVKSDFIPGKEG